MKAAKSAGVVLVKGAFTFGLGKAFGPILFSAGLFGLLVLVVGGIAMTVWTVKGW